MIRLVDIYGTGKILRTSEAVFDIPGQVTAVKEFEATKAEQNADAVGIVAFVFRLCFEIRATDFDLRRPWFFAQYNTIGSQYQNSQRGRIFRRQLQPDEVTGLQDYRFALDGLLVSLNRLWFYVLR